MKYKGRKSALHLYWERIGLVNFHTNEGSVIYGLY